MDIKHFVTYYSQAEIKNNAETKEVESNEIQHLLIPSRVYGFKTFDRPTDDIYKGGKKIVSKNEKINEELFYIGTVLSLQEIKKQFGEKAYTSLLAVNAYGGVKTKDEIILPLKNNQKVTILNPDQFGIVRIGTHEEMEME